MGMTPIPIVPPPPLGDEEIFRRSITPKPARFDEVLNLTIVVLLLLAPSLLVAWMVLA